MIGVKKMKKLIVCLLCCSLTCICAMFNIQIGIVPISLVGLAVILSGALLGPVYGSISQILYLLLVFIGFPFTSKLAGGPSYFAGPTAGYMIGYVFKAFIVGYIYYHFGKPCDSYFKRMFWFVVGAAIGTVVCLFIGSIWCYMVIYKKDFFSAIAAGSGPFLIGDSLKIVAVGLILPKLEKTLDL